MSALTLESMDDFVTLTKFDSEQLAPYLSETAFFRSPESDYHSSQIHSRYVDQLLGFNILITEEQINHSLYQGLESWDGLSADQLQTPYDELLLMTQFLQLHDDEHIVDLGAGYGRLAFIIAQQNPRVKFSGLELVSERVECGNRIFKQHDLPNALLIEQDLLKTELKEYAADVYFLYDFGQKEHLKIVLDQLDELAVKRDFRLVARGRGVRSLIHYSYPRFCHAIDPIHFETFSVYSTP